MAKMKTSKIRLQELAGLKEESYSHHNLEDIAKEIIDMISMEQNESGEFDYDDVETYIVDILKKRGIK